MTADGPPPAGVADRLIAAGLWTAGLAWLAGMLVPYRLALGVLPVERTEPLARAYVRGQLALTLCRWRAVVDPAVDPATPYLFVQNHVNVLDHVTMYDATPHLKQGLELRRHFDIPIYGPFMRARGTIPVEPGGGPAALVALRRAMADTLARGHSLLAFPEGTRTRTGRVGPFREGVFHLARQLGVPIVPVAVTGMWDVLPTGSWVMRPFREVTVHVLAPVPTAGLTRDEVPALAREVRARIAALVDAHMEGR